MRRSFLRQPRHPNLRLPGRVYARNGSYLVTTVVRSRAYVLSVVQCGTVRLTDAGEATADALGIVIERYGTIAVDGYVIMPDHVHVILSMTPDNSITLRQVVGAFKGLAAKRINVAWGRAGPFWQRGFHDRVIRNAAELAACRRYIANNPRRWPAPHCELRADM
jgi:putative transposase